MAFSLNRAQIIGNLTRDPEVRMAGDQKVVTFGVATNFVWKDQTGQKKERAEFHNVVAWRKLAEICEMYLRKGRRVYIEGRLQTREWEGKDGIKRYRTEIVAENMLMLDGKGQVTSGAGTGFGALRTQQSIKQDTLSAPDIATTPDIATPVPEPEEEVSIDDLPF